MKFSSPDSSFLFVQCLFYFFLLFPIMSEASDSQNILLSAEMGLDSLGYSDTPSVGSVASTSSVARHPLTRGETTDPSFPQPRHQKVMATTSYGGRPHDGQR